MTLEHRIEMQMRCTLCNQQIGDMEYSKRTVDVALFGAKKYAYCPKCKQSTVSKMRDPEWRKLLDGSKEGADDHAARMRRRLANMEGRYKRD